jgi:FlaA1/EpsC-like NDP-sugar epimerase
MHQINNQKMTIANHMLSLSRPAKRLVAVCVDIGLCVVTVWLAMCLRFDTWVTIQGNQWLPIIFSPVIAIPLFVIFGLYRAILRYAGREVLIAVTKAISIYAIIYSAIFTAIGFTDVPRTIGLLQPILLLIGVGITRLLATQILSDPYILKISDINAPKVLIYGAGSSGLALATSLAKQQNMKVVGFLDDNPSLHRGQLMGLEVFNPKKLVALVQKMHVNDVLLALPNISRARRNQILKHLSSTQVSVRTLPTLSDLATGKVDISQIRDLDIEDLLGRDPVASDEQLMGKNIINKIILVTGAGGSIGSEICRQIIRLQPKQLILVELNEFALYSINDELESQIQTLQLAPIALTPVLANVQDAAHILALVAGYRPHTIYHAAAYKHVPLVEDNPLLGLRNNVLGTLHTARAAITTSVENFVLISTDKAVRPTNVMGASKRFAEMVLQALAQDLQAHQPTQFSIVRFGNVLGSSGSVVPKFREQIKSGGPVTVTHPEITRYFMTIPEAAQLVIQAAALPQNQTHKAQVFLLDMGESVKITDLAKTMIQLSGLTTKDQHGQGDIAIHFSGLRPGEKLYEELLIGNNPQETQHPKIMYANEDFMNWSELQFHIHMLEKLPHTEQNNKHIKSMLATVVSQYTPQ